MKTKTLFIALAALIVSTVLIEKEARADYLPGEQTAQEQVDSYDMIVAFLETPQFMPSRLEFRKLSPDAVADLARVATSTRVSTAIRSRAVQSLALYVDDARAVETVDSLMETTRTSDKLFPALVVSYGQIHGDGSAQKLQELAEVRQDQVRLAAVIALGRYGGQAGYEALLRLKESESNEAILERIRSYTH